MLIINKKTTQTVRRSQTHNRLCINNGRQEQIRNQGKIWSQEWFRNKDGNVGTQ
jgi:hypothetical protein